MAAALEYLFHGRDQAFAAVEPETLGTGEFLVQVLLKTLGFEQPVEDGALAPGGEKGLVVDGFHALLEPRLLARVLDVHEFDADVAAIGLMQDRHDLAHGRRFLPQHLTFLFSYTF